MNSCSAGETTLRPSSKCACLLCYLTTFVIRRRGAWKQTTVQPFFWLHTVLLFLFKPRWLLPIILVVSEMLTWPSETQARLFLHHEAGNKMDRMCFNTSVKSQRKYCRAKHFHWIQFYLYSAFYNRNCITVIIKQMKTQCPNLDSHTRLIIFSQVDICRVKNLSPTELWVAVKRKLGHRQPLCIWQFALLNF